ncbi:MAG: VapE domain-containing protein [Eudoraea sp.]|uniref:VapE domain-containing protein n=1 Tax=Eudoraea sp. TaxID=1979955 RepID=UPI0032641D95
MSALDLNNIRINFFKNIHSSSVNEELFLLEYLDNIKEGFWQDIVLDIRRGKMSKKNAPGVTISGVFKEARKDENLKKHSSIIAIDIDKLDNPQLDFERIVKKLKADKYCFAVHNSIGGFGLVLYVKIDPLRHRDSYFAIEKYLAENYKIITDSTCQNESRLRFVSYDPGLFLNKESALWEKYLAQEKLPPKVSHPIAFHKDDIDYIMTQINERGINMADEYLDWVKLGFAIASEYGESGRDYFHVISGQSTKYNSKDCDKQYDNSIRSYSPSHGVRGGITIATFFWYCQQFQIDIKTPKTIEIENLGFDYMKNSISKKGGAMSTELIQEAQIYLENEHGITKERSKSILEKINIKNITKSNKRTNDLENFLRKYDLKHNEVTSRVELKGVAITDRDINTIYVDAMKVLGYDISKAKIYDFINSKFVQSFNPFNDFFEEHKHLKADGNFSELLECFYYEKPKIPLNEMSQDERDSDYLEVFMERWLVGMISAMHGTYSLLILVLNGPQGSGKSKFFRGLLPEKLSPYYAESKLDSGKDDEILMTNSILIMDDEFSGKSKGEAKKLKEISSREFFTIRKPYGRTSEKLRRYAVLCGTSNDEKILNDPTGNRRLIPVNVKKIDIKRFEAINKNELFMELYRLWLQLGDGWMLKKEEIDYLNKATWKNEQPSYEEEMIMKYFEPAENEQEATLLTASDIKNKIETGSKEKIYVNKLGASLKKLGFKQIRKTSKRCYLVKEKEINEPIIRDF